MAAELEAALKLAVVALTMEVRVRGMMGLTRVEAEAVVVQRLVILVLLLV